MISVKRSACCCDASPLRLELAILNEEFPLKGFVQKAAEWCRPVWLPADACLSPSQTSVYETFLTHSSAPTLIAFTAFRADIQQIILPIYSSWFRSEDKAFAGTLHLSPSSSSCFISLQQAEGYSPISWSSSSSLSLQALFVSSGWC